MLSRLWDETLPGRTRAYVSAWSLHGLLSGDDTVFLVSPHGVGDLVEADTGNVRYLR